MQDFLWHKVSREEQEKIKREAKGIMDSFAKALEKAEDEISDNSDNFNVKRENQLRNETSVRKEKEFRKIFFENAPNKSGDFIKAEKGKWK